MRRNVFRALLPLMALPLMVACPFQQEEDNSEQANMLLMLTAMPEQMELNGTWSDGFSTHSILASRTISGGTSGFWNSGGNGTVLEFSNSTRTAYVKTGIPGWCTGQGAAYPNCPCFSAGECYNRNVWTKSGGDFYYCQIVYNKSTLDAAKADATTADPSNPSANGCGGFAWSKMTPQ